MKKKFLPIIIIILAAVLFSGYFFHSSKKAETSKPQIKVESVSVPFHIPIIVYHAVHPEHPGETLEQRKFNVTPELLEQQLQYLKDKHYITISLDQLPSYLDSTTTLDKNIVVLTFDDGWHDQYTQAFPLLKKYNDIATFYVYTNPIGKDSRFLTWDEVKEMKSAGMTIGSHTLSHPFLTKVSTEQLKKEIFNSKKVLEEKLGISIVNFASPFGDSNPQIEGFVKEAGYLTGRDINKKSIYSKDDLFHLPGYFAPQNMHDFIWILKYAP